MLCMPWTWQSWQIFLFCMSSKLNANIDPPLAKILVDWGWKKRNDLPIYRSRCQKYDTPTRSNLLSLKHQIFTNCYTYTVLLLSCMNLSSLYVKFGYLGNLGNFLLQVYEDNWLSKAKWSQGKIIFSALISEPFQTLWILNSWEP